jgi:hypothetical protein
VSLGRRVALLGQGHEQEGCDDGRNPPIGAFSPLGRVRCRSGHEEAQPEPCDPEQAYPRTEQRFYQQPEA